MMMSVAGTLSPESRQREASRRDACQTAASMEHVKAVRRLFQREDVAAPAGKHGGFAQVVCSEPGAGESDSGANSFFLFLWLP